MRILAIRGSDLASLAGRFALELDQEPFRSAGLFAITGPTGSGKSTILDALCLALYDKTPRLVSTGGALVGHAHQADALRVRSTDVRGIMRRGAGECWAEVDFQVADGYRYRSRWAVHRARNQRAGRLQAQSLLLECLDTGEQWGGKKTAVLAEIQARVGLSFDQFRRSALLAQGDFAAFLHANAADRTNLLERMTGTGIYGRLSVAAFVRAKKEQQDLDDLAAARKAVGMLDPTERAALETEVDPVRRQLARAVALREELKAQVQWHADRVEHSRRVALGEAELARAEEAWDGGREHRDLVASVREAQKLRPLLERVRRAATELAAAREEVEGAVDAKRAGEENVVLTEARRVSAVEAAQRARHDRDQARPDLERAEHLDVQLETARERLDQSASASGAASAEAARLEGVSAAARVEVERAEGELLEASRWLDDHPDAAELARHWPLVRLAIERFTAAADGLVASTGRLARAVEHQVGVGARAEQARSDVDRAREAATLALAAREGAERASAPEQRLALRERRAALEVRRQQAEVAVQAAVQAREARDEQGRARQAAAEARAEVEAQGSLAAAAESRAHELGIRIDQVERDQERVSTVRRLKRYRARLGEGEECPLCGSREHPWAHQQVSFAFDPGLGDELERLRGQLAEARQGAAASRAEAAAASRRAEEQGDLAASAEARLEAPRTAWAALELAGLPADPLHPDAPGAASDIAAAVRAGLQALAADEQRLDHLELQAREAREAHEVAVAGVAAATERQLACEAEVRDGQARSVQLEGVVESHRAAREAALGDLTQALGEGGGWLERLRADPAGFGQGCDEVVRAWTGHSQRAQAATAALAELRPHHVEARTLAASAREAAVQTTARLAELQGAWEALRVGRAALLDGRSTAAVRSELDQGVHAAEVALDAARSAADLATRDQARVRAELEAARRAAVERDQFHRAATAELEAGLQAPGLDLQRLESLLVHDRTWLHEAEQGIEAQREAARMARARLEERRSLQAEHAALSAPELDAEQASAALLAATAERDEAQGRVSVIEHELERDDSARLADAALAADIDLQREEADLWRTLSDLIGSQSGQKFAQFAQGLTLDALLVHANHHLGELAPRYFLARVPGEDLALQVVDRDMGDEVRAIHSLSGGETFLASLALALGLSSMSSADTRVESLFIDEGFGTLDKHTLDDALAALDALQASGRHVGIISHVQGLADQVGVQVRVRKLGAGRSEVIPP